MGQTTNVMILVGGGVTRENVKPLTEALKHAGFYYSVLWRHSLRQASSVIEMTEVCSEDPFSHFACSHQARLDVEDTDPATPDQILHSVKEILEYLTTSTVVILTDRPSEEATKLLTAGVNVCDLQEVEKFLGLCSQA